MKDAKGHGSDGKGGGLGPAPLSARNLSKFGLRRGAYDGGSGRRFVTFSPADNGNERRTEFTSKGERDAHVMGLLSDARAATELARGNPKANAAPVHPAMKDWAGRTDADLAKDYGGPVRHNDGKGSSPVTPPGRPIGGSAVRGIADRPKSRG